MPQAFGGMHFRGSCLLSNIVDCSIRYCFASSHLGNCNFEGLSGVKLLGNYNLHGVALRQTIEKEHLSRFCFVSSKLLRDCDVEVLVLRRVFGGGQLAGPCFASFVSCQTSGEIPSFSQEELRLVANKQTHTHTHTHSQTPNRYTYRNTPCTHAHRETNKHKHKQTHTHTHLCCRFTMITTCRGDSSSSYFLNMRNQFSIAVHHTSETNASMQRFKSIIYVTNCPLAIPVHHNVS